jgi:hypothetical protein
MSRIDEIKFQMNILQKELKQLESTSVPVAGYWYNGFRNYLIYVSEVHKKSGYNRLLYYGFAPNWETNDYIANLEIEGSLKKANVTKIAYRLIKEAKNRGFDEGVKFRYIQGQYVGDIIPKAIISNFEIAYQYDYNRLIINNGKHVLTIFKDGIWAEIVKE